MEVSKIMLYSQRDEGVGQLAFKPWTSLGGRACPNPKRVLSIPSARLFECLKGVMCWHREVDLEYMYLYQPGRKPSRQFH